MLHGQLLSRLGVGARGGRNLDDLVQGQMIAGGVLRQFHRRPVQEIERAPAVTLDDLAPLGDLRVARRI